MLHRRYMIVGSACRNPGLVPGQVHCVFTLVTLGMSPTIYFSLKMRTQCFNFKEQHPSKSNLTRKKRLTCDSAPGVKYDVIESNLDIFHV
jgi:hypothetical protein